MSNSSKWRDVRAPIAPYIDAVFRQDLAIGDPEKRRSVDWILDCIVRPEFEALLGEESADRWLVMRMDDNGNEVEVRSGLTFAEVDHLRVDMERKGHKQIYWIRKE